MTGSAPRKRQRRDQRPSAPRRMYETERDRLILRLVYDYRILSQRQLEQLLGKSRSTVQQALVRLYHHRYLERVFPAVSLLGSSPTYYILDRRGREALQRLGIADFSGQPDRDVSELFLHHTLAINTCRIAISQAAARTGWHISRWQTESQIKADYDRVSARTRDGRLKDVPIVPDSYFTLTIPQRGTAHFFLELDRGRMDLRRFRNKVVGYVAYYKQGGFERRYGAKGFRVLTVVDTESGGQGRVRNLAQQAASVPGIGRRFWFTHLTQATPEAVLSQPIWHIAGDEMSAPLFQQV